MDVPEYRHLLPAHGDRAPSSSGSYQVTTSVDAPGGPGQRARDHRDVFVTSSPDGLDWSAQSVLVNDDPPNFDNWLPEIAVTGGGQIYVAWYDWRDSPAVDVRRSGADVRVALRQTAARRGAALGPITDGATAWTFVNPTHHPEPGRLHLDVRERRRHLPVLGADGRIGTPDVFAAPFLVNGLQVAIVERRRRHRSRAAHLAGLRRVAAGRSPPSTGA